MYTYKNFIKHCTWITLTFVFTFANAGKAFAWENYETLDHHASKVSIVDLERLVETTERTYGIKVSYIKPGNKNIQDLSKIELKTVLFDFIPFGYIEYNPSQQDPIGAAYEQLVQINRAADKALASGKIRSSDLLGYEVILFSDNAIRTKDQLGFVNAAPAFACADAVSDYAIAAKYIFSQKMLDAAMERPAEIAVAGTLGGSLAFVLQALRTGSCWVGDIPRDIGSRVGLLDLNKHAIIFEADEIAPVIEAK